MQYELTLPQKIVFGLGKIREIGELAKNLGHRAILICGSRTLEKLSIVRQIVYDLEHAGVSVLTTETISHEPLTEDVDRLVARLHGAYLPNDFVIGFGGGAAIDLGKTIAALVPQEQAPIADYLEGVGRGLKLKSSPLPMLAVPTTAGTGTEVTKNAVITSFNPPFKKSIRDDRMMPHTVLIDPELTRHCSLKVTAESGLDTVTQLLESYVTKKHQPFTDALVEQGLPTAVKALQTLLTQPDHLESRCAMAHAAMLSGMALAHSGLGMAHGIAPALGTHCRMTHGAACALLLPVTLRTNMGVCAERYGKLARLTLGLGKNVSDEDAVEELVGCIEYLRKDYGLPTTLSAAGISSELIPAIAADSKGNSMSGNPKELSASEIENILRSIC